VLTITCSDSSNISLPGARVGDPCLLGIPTASIVANANFSCRVSATDTVLVRMCAAGTATADPASGSFQVRVFSNQ